MSNKSTISSKVAIIAGTGFEDAFGASANAEKVVTPYGPAEYNLVKSGDRTLLIMSRHGKDHSVPPHRINHKANMWAIKNAGTTSVISTAACGSLRRDRMPGDVLILDDFIDFRGQVTTYFDGDGESIQHTDFSEPFSATLRGAIIRCSKAALANDAAAFKVYNEGTYLCTSGPRYESPAEVRMFNTWGADVVGMTVAPEAILARELGLLYAAVAVVTNLGTGLSESALSHGEVTNQMLQSKSFLVSLLRISAEALFSYTD